MATLTPIEPWLAQRLEAVKLLALDVDGVLTDGRLTYTSAGDELKTFSVKDGQGLAVLIRQEFPVAIITARQSNMVEQRARELRIPYVFQGVKDKLKVLNELLAELNLSLDQVAYIGDDLPDVGILQSVGLAACPADAVTDVKRLCHYVSSAPGGMGCVRELIDMLVHLQNRWPVNPPKEVPKA